MVVGKKNTQGFTVVEMLLGIALFAIIIPTLIVALNSISLINENSKDLAVANIFAENKIEELRSIGYNSIATGTTDMTSQLPTSLGRYRSGTLTITQSVAGQKSINLSITIESRSRTKTLNYRSIIGELGVGQ
jgi:type II secretory pathway pseudopilin PulG